MIFTKLDEKTAMISNVVITNKAEKLINRGMGMKWETPLALFVFIVGVILAVSIQ